VVNASKVVTDANEVSNIVSGIKSSFESNYTKSFDGNNFSASMNSLMNDGKAITEGLAIILYDAKTTEKDGKIELVTGSSKAGETQNNMIKVAVSIDGKPRTQEDINRTASHELGHSGGLYHPWNKENDIEDIKQGSPNVSNETIKANLMNSNENPKLKSMATKGTEVTKGQMEKIKGTVEKQQPKK
ncbi:MAG TPA: hypothetical protein V6C58_19530, partial [Allocoleopsis sp.]